VSARKTPPPAPPPERRKPARPAKRRRLAEWLQLGLFDAAKPLPPALPAPEIRVPVRLREAIREEQAQRLARKLSARMQVPLASLTLTDNRSVLLSTTRQGGRLQLRLHRSFVDADRDALEAAAAFAVGCGGERKRQALARLRAHVDSWRQDNEDDEAISARALRHRTSGTWHDVGAIRDKLNVRWFDGEVEPGITWGRWSSLRGRRRTIRLGSYDARENLIRIHPALDQSWVPRLFVEAVVHHEMLHAQMPAQESGGRRCLHGPEFRRRERELPAYKAAEIWLASNLHKLLRSRPPR
jgi:predicted metal-dependent hydrolase